MSVLNEAKLNLKNSLNRLEKAIDVKIKQLVEEREQNQRDKEELVSLRELESIRGDEGYEPGSDPQMLQELAAEVKKLNAELNDKLDEITYLREQNSELGGKLGAEVEKSNNIQNILSETGIKVDFMIGEIRQHMANKG
jgi:predicted  nucleic acid-binding Zn-ribbon protein